MNGWMWIGWIGCATNGGDRPPPEEASTSAGDERAAGGELLREITLPGHGEGLTVAARGDRIWVGGHTMDAEGLDASAVVVQLSPELEVVQLQSLPDSWNLTLSGIAIARQDRIALSAREVVPSYHQKRNGYLIMLDMGLEEIWRRHEGTRAHAVGVDGTGDLFVAGLSQSRIIVSRFDPAGAQVWSRQDPDPFSVGCVDLAVDPAGRTVCAGRYEGRANQFRPDGGLATQFQLDQRRVDAALFSDDGEVVLAGALDARNPDGNWGSWVGRFALDGEQLWMSTEEGPDQSNGVVALAEDPASGDIVAVEWRNKPFPDSEMVVRKLDASGAPVWRATIDPSYGLDVLHDVAILEDGHVVVVGTQDQLTVSQRAWLGLFTP